LRKPESNRRWWTSQNLLSTTCCNMYFARATFAKADVVTWSDTSTFEICESTLLMLGQRTTSLDEENKQFWDPKIQRLLSERDGQVSHVEEVRTIVLSHPASKSMNYHTSHKHKYWYDSGTTRSLHICQFNIIFRVCGTPYCSEPSLAKLIINIL